jgi:hypothetical protein
MKQQVQIPNVQIVYSFALSPIVDCRIIAASIPNLCTYNSNHILLSV